MIKTILNLASIMGTILAVIIYFIPSYLAFKHNHPSKVFIVLLNAFLGWTVIGYIISLLWVIYGNKNKATRKQQF